MKIRYFLFLAVVMTITGSNNSFAHVLEQSPGSMKPRFHDPHEAIEIFLNAVSRGELTVFDQKIDKSMLIPVRVEYVYELSNSEQRVKIYSELKQPMPVPNQQDCKLRAISVILDADGHIIETVAHIWPD